jgi:glycosyltransferase involved in cell wall biosynthesis
MPVIVTPGIGDLVTIVERHRVGVVLDGDDDAALELAVRDLEQLLDDPSLPDRCRAVARELFDVETGSRRYADLYERVVST